MEHLLPGQRLRVGPGLHRWGRGTCYYPNWAIDWPGCDPRPAQQLHVRGAGMGPWRAPAGGRRHRVFWAAPEAPAAGGEGAVLLGRLKWRVRWGVAAG